MENGENLSLGDLESKFVEAALGNVQITDYRNFAHGRHNWLNRRLKSTILIALITPEDRELAEKTLKLLPKDAQVLKIESENSGPVSSIELLLNLFFLIQALAEKIKIDPGAPNIPLFGRRLYGITPPTFSDKKELFARNISLEYASIRRKIRATDGILDKKLEYWKNAFSSFLLELGKSKFHSIVLDYDGTMCDHRMRFSGVDYQIGSRINNLVKQGITVGIATGRGKSVRSDMQQVIEKQNREKVWIGYYNGSDIGLLDDEKHPQKNTETKPILKEFSKIIQQYNIDTKIKTIAIRPNQISIEPTTSNFYGVWDLLQDAINRYGLREVQVLESSHSFDILAPDVSKLALVDWLTRNTQTSKDGEILCIGDKGKWPGNDYELLSRKYSLSADTVSPNPHSCWNIAPLGSRGVQATNYYLKALKVDGKLISFGKPISGGS